MYSEKVMDHFRNPRNVGEIEEANGVGEVGNAKCGDIMKIYLKVENNIIEDVKFKTYGCGSAIASSSMATELIKGKTLEEALAISKEAVANELGGLPPQKMHCSNLGADALIRPLELFRGLRGRQAREAATDDENVDVGLHGTLLSSRLDSALSKTIARTYLFPGAGRTAFARSRPTKAARARSCGSAVAPRLCHQEGRAARGRESKERCERRWRFAPRGGSRALGSGHRPRDPHRTHREPHEDVLWLRSGLRRGAEYARVPGLPRHARRAPRSKPVRDRSDRPGRARDELRDRAIQPLPSQTVLLSRHAEGLPDLPIRPAVL